MKLPPYIKPFKKGDSNTYPVTTRLPRGGYQFLIELMSEWGIEERSAVLRAVVQFAQTWMPKIAKQEGCEFSERFLSIIEFQNTRRELLERKALKAQLYEALADAESVNEPVLKTRLLASAEKMARVHGLPWPLPELPYLNKDSEARYLLDRIAAVLSESEDGRVTLRELQRRSKFEADETLDVLSRLEVQGYVVLETERRSGPPTVWIALPSMQLEQVET